jgi:hypothetical protein
VAGGLSVQFKEFKVIPGVRVIGTQVVEVVTVAAHRRCELPAAGLPHWIVVCRKTVHIDEFDSFERRRLHGPQIKRTRGRGQYARYAA